MKTTNNPVVKTICLLIILVSQGACSVSPEFKEEESLQPAKHASLRAFQGLSKEPDQDVMTQEDDSFKFVERVLVQPRNDDCAGAIQILPNGQLITGNTASATYEDFLDTCNITKRSPDLWYSVIGTGNVMRAHTCSDVTNFDTMISVYTGVCGNFECVGTDDDGCRSLSSSITWDAELSVTYFIRVFGYNEAVPGDFGLTVSSFEPAVNSRCDGAIAISTGEEIEGSIETAHDSDGWYGCSVEYNQPTLWYYIDGTGKPLKVSTCSKNSTFSGAIQVVKGTNCSDLLCEDTSYEWSSFIDNKCVFPSPAAQFFAEQGTRYYILLSSGPNLGQNDTFTLSATEFEPAPNDVCETASRITNFRNGTTVLGSTYNAFPDNITCGYNYVSPTSGVWYSITGTGGTLSFSTCSTELDFDSAIYVFSGDCEQLECIAADSYGHRGCEQSTFGSARTILNTVVGVEYYILISGSYQSAVGDFGLTIAEANPPPNDLCDNAIKLSLDTGRVIGSISDATSDYGLNNTCGYSYETPSVWYSLLGTGDVYAISTCSSELNFNSALSVSTGSCNNHECLISSSYSDQNCSDSSYSLSRVVFPTEVGVEYFIAVEGVDNPVEGVFALTISTVDVPRNDECSGAIAIDSSADVVYGSITNATGFMGPDSSCAYNYGAPSVWYSLMGTGDVYAISTCSSELNFDSALSVSTGSCDNQTCYTSSSYSGQNCSESSYSFARVVFPTEVGVEYFISVEGLNSPTEGDFALKISTVDVPSNDECSGAIAIGPSDNVVYGSITNATGFVGPGSCAYNYGAPSVWYSLLGTGDVYAISTCSSKLNFDSALSVSTGSCDNQTCLTSSSYSGQNCSESSYSFARVVFPTKVGVEYFISVEGLNSPTEGDFALKISTVDVPRNDECSGAISIDPRNRVIQGSITNATAFVGSGISCVYYYDAPSVWYSLNGTGDVYLISTCSSALNFDSALSVSTGSCDNQECITFNSNNGYSCSDTVYSAATVVIATDVGVEYFISVEGLNYPSQGKFDLTISKVEVAANDDCSGAVLIQPDNTTIYGSTVNATVSKSTNSSSCFVFDNSPDLWYRVEGTGTLLTASLCGERTMYDSQLAIFEGSAAGCDQSCILVSNDDYCGYASQVEWPTEIGVTYFIRVFGFGTSVGPFELRVF